MTPGAVTRHGDAVRTGPARGGRGALLPAGTAAAALALAAAAQLLLDPFGTDLPLCLVHQLTGLHCPGCGGTRALHALLAGDLVLALRSNAPAVLALPLALVTLARWTLRRVHGRPAPAAPPWWMLVAIPLALAAFGVLRNLPALELLAPIPPIGA